MIISIVNYSQNIGKANEWHLKDVNLGKLNLIVSRNAIGKTRTVNIINAFARMLSSRIPRLLNGNWDIVFEHNNSFLHYILRIDKGKVVEETLDEDGKTLLKREGGTGEYLAKGGEKVKYYPPETKLTIQVRRDKRELPYLEQLIEWAEKYRSFSFSNVRPNYILARLPVTIGDTGPDLAADDLGTAPYLLDEVRNNAKLKKGIIKDLAYMGYKVNDLAAIKSSVPGFPGDVFTIRVAETGIDFPISQSDLSQGMYRVIAITVMIHYLMQGRAEGTMVIDDIGEGLDFERSSKLTEIIFDRAKNTGIQLIATSNDRFLMNTIDIKYWNIFERKGKTVQAFNYKNSKNAFEEFALTGLNNFDFFADRLYRVKTHD
jgi:hypothetical protein